MFISAIKFSLDTFNVKVKKNFLVLISLLIFSFLIDISRELIDPINQTALIAHGLIETVGTCFLYSLLLNELLGISKINFLNFFTYLRVNILYSIFYLVGSIFLIIPGFYILTFFYFAPIIALEGNEDGNYFKKSKVLVKKSPFSVFGIGISLLLLMGLDFYFSGLIKDYSSSELAKYSLSLFSNLLVILMDYLLFIATIFLYRDLSKK